jgi:predicted GIY-YIG superfamily endonuclease
VNFGSGADSVGGSKTPQDTAEFFAYPTSVPTDAALATGEIALITGAAFVYEAVAADGEVLYVGVTDQIFRRLGEHLHRDAPWVWEAVTLRWSEYHSREVAETAERRRIVALMPRYNVTHNGRRLPADRMGHHTVYTSDAWARLGKVVRARREGMRQPQHRAARQAGFEVATWRALERGGGVEYPPEVLAAVDRVLDWPEGSHELVLAGGVPDPLTEEQLSARAVAAHREFTARRPA